MRLVIKNSIQLCLRTLVFSIVLIAFKLYQWDNFYRGYFFGGHPHIVVVLLSFNSQEIGCNPPIKTHKILTI
jgi:hypothetical protein